jgi:transcriptional regulator with XRE-family HTH domain
MDDRTDIGARIKARRGKLYSQRELAEKAGVSIDTIRNLEQGKRRTAAIGTLHRIAHALDIDVAELLAKATPLPSDDPRAGVVAMRRVLTSVDDLLGDVADTGEPTTLEETRRATNYAWGSYWAGKYDQLGALLPHAIIGARATEHAAPSADRADAVDLLAQLYQVAGCTLVHLGQPDSAWLALRAALAAAERGQDELRAATLRGSLAWLLLTQGRYEEACRVAVQGAAAIDPVGEASLPHLSVWGSLLLTAATAAGRERRERAAADFLAEARVAANRIAVDRNDYETAFGPSQVTMQTVDVHVVTEHYSAALTTARQMPRDNTLPLAARSRHLADVAFSQTRLGQRDRAIDTLLTVETAAPDWMRHQSLPRQTIAELLERERPSRLRELAMRVGATTG